MISPIISLRLHFRLVIVMSLFWSHIASNFHCNYTNLVFENQLGSIYVLFHSLFHLMGPRFWNRCVVLCGFHHYRFHFMYRVCFECRVVLSGSSSISSSSSTLEGCCLITFHHIFVLLLVLLNSFDIDEYIFSCGWFLDNVWCRRTSSCTHSFCRHCFLHGRLNFARRHLGYPIGCCEHPQRHYHFFRLRDCFDFGRICFSCIVCCCIATCGCRTVGCNNGSKTVQCTICSGILFNYISCELGLLADDAISQSQGLEVEHMIPFSKINIPFQKYVQVCLINFLLFFSGSQLGRCFTHVPYLLGT